MPQAWVRLQAVLTNTVPVAPYRGAGRPETTFIVERLLDIAAQRHGFDRVKLRKRNVVTKGMLSYRNIMGLTYDSGDFSANMDRALHLARWDAFPIRRAESAQRGYLRGIGVANYVESPVGVVKERLTVAVTDAGFVEIVSGTQSTGQGHETVFAQVIGEYLGVEMDRVRLITGDTGTVEVGGGTHSDRTMRLGGKLLVEACGKIIFQGRAIAARVLGCDPAEVRFADGLFTAADSNRSLDLSDVARAERDAGGRLTATAEVAKRIPAHPTGCAVCELEVEPATGMVHIVDYTSIDDVGQPINPMIVEGQVHGGIVMGIGEALSESFSVNQVSGQVASGSFMDYAVLRADNLPRLKIELVEDPTAGTPLRVKGGGECGITPAAAAVINALVDALAGYGIEHVDLPATPHNVWRAIHTARATS